MDGIEKSSFRDFLKKIFGEGTDAELSAEAREMLKSKTRIVRLNKGEYLQIEGDVCKYWGYVVDGLVRVYYLRQDEEITEQLACNGEWFLMRVSLTNRRVGILYKCWSRLLFIYSLSWSVRTCAKTIRRLNCFSGN